MDILAISRRDQTLRDVILSRISNLGKLAMSVLVLLTILLVLVEQQMHQYAIENDVAVRARMRAGLRMNAVMKSLIERRGEFFTRLNKPNPSSKRSKRRSSALPGFADATPPVSLTDGEHAAIKRVFEREFVKQKWDEQRAGIESAEKPLKAAIDKASEAEKPLKAAIDKASEAIGSTRKLGLQAALPLGDKSVSNYALKSALAEDVELLDTYAKTLQILAGDREKVKALDERLVALEAKRETIPTPFGSFQVDPLIALLGMAFGALLSYLYFASSSLGIVRFARMLVGDLDDAGVDAVAVPSPVWLYTADVRVRRLLSWRKNTESSHALATVLLHLAWISLGTVAAIDAWRRSAARALVFDPHGVAYALLFVLLLIAAALFAATFSEKVGDVSADAAALLTTRRAAIPLLVLGIVGTGMMMLVRRGRKSRRDRKRMPARMAPPATDEDLDHIVVNRKSGVAHHLDVCQHHLPHSENRRYGADSHAPLHRRWEAAVLYGMVMDIDSSLEEATRSRLQKLLRNSVQPLPPGRIVPLPPNIQVRDLRVLWASDPANKPATDQMIAVLTQAIHLEPWSYHLHHKLMRLYGRQKRYPEIRKNFSPKRGISPKRG